MSGSGRGHRWRSHAFGLELDSSFEPAGWHPDGSPPGFRKVRIGIAERGELRRAVPAGSETIAWSRTRAGKEKPLILAHPRAGYWLQADGYGLFHVTTSGEEIRCAPLRVAPWRWQRFLVGQVLPFASTLNGYEPLHASAVALGGHAIAFVGGMGFGKSTLAAQLMLRGGRLIADDVVALAAEPGAGAPRAAVAYPGPGLMSLRRGAIERLGAGEVRRIGTRVGQDRDGMRLAVDRCDHSMPLSVLYLLEPMHRTKAVTLKTITEPDPRQLLGSTFNAALRNAQRLVRQLDVCAAVARSVRLVQIRVAPEADHHELADRVLADLQSQRGGER